MIPRRRSLLALVTEAYGGRGGIAQYNRDLFSALAQVEDPITIDILPRLAPDPVGVLPDAITQRRPYPGKVRYSARAILVALQTKPDMLFCGHLFMAPLCAFIARLTGAAMIVQLHGVEIWSVPSPSQRAAMEKATMILCVSRYTRGEVLRHTSISRNRVRVLPNTYSTEYTPGDREAARARFDIDPGAFCILSVGRLDARERYKGQDRVIDALPTLRVQRPDLVYLISGEGDDRPRLEARAQEKGVADVVRFLGHLPREALPDLYRAADLFALPSTGEGFGIVFLEAMACGTPAIGLGVAGARDALAAGDLGSAPKEWEFGRELIDLVTTIKRDEDALSAAVKARFGQERFVAHADQLFASIMPE